MLEARDRLYMTAGAPGTHAAMMVSTATLVAVLATTLSLHC